MDLESEAGPSLLPVQALSELQVLQQRSEAVGSVSED